MIPNKNLSSLVRATSRAVAITIGSTTCAVAGALLIERSAHRTLFTYFPHWYQDVDHASGLDKYQLEAVRRVQPSEETTYLINSGALKMKDNVGWVERSGICDGVQIANCAITS
mmetsp:Transcript_13444/g.19819  ORF Transcript_13444/g.19819 Transcript_13444/m.19819 type:complete len:114 (+) Transcript_13444:20-361(+)